MNCITFDCKTVTPLLMSGARKEIPELRPPSIKGMMRFWWRAMNGHQTLPDLKHEEALIFGSCGNNGERCPFSLQTKYLGQPASRQKIEFQSRVGNFSGFNGNEPFTITMRGYAEPTEAENTLKVAIRLGGLGKRSRRGYGAVQICKIQKNDAVNESLPLSLESICLELNSVVTGGFVVDNVNNKILPNPNVSRNSDAKYPHILEIEVGNPLSDMTDLLKKIMNSASDHNSYYTGEVKPGRFASPIYVTVADTEHGYVPIITTLNCAFSEKFEKTIAADPSAKMSTKSNSSDFKKDILS